MGASETKSVAGDLEDAAVRVSKENGNKGLKMQRKKMRNSCFTQPIDERLTVVYEQTSMKVHIVIPSVWTACRKVAAQCKLILLVKAHAPLCDRMCSAHPNKFHGVAPVAIHPTHCLRFNARIP